LIEDVVAMPNLYPVARHIFGRFQPEFARDLTVRCLEAGLGDLMVDASALRPDAPNLAQRIWNLEFSNPIGLAAGFDKDARVPDAILRSWRLGFVEVGTVTPLPQSGNKKPRVFRLREDHAIINRMGFNSCGLEDALARLKSRVDKPGIVGLNLGKNRDTEDATEDYVAGIRAAADLVSYLVVNVSSPNTPGLRDLQRRAPLENLLKELIATRNSTKSTTPLLVKIAPDLSEAECEDISAVALELGIDGIIVSNTTTSRPAGLTSKEASEEGGLSGKPLFDKSTHILAQIHKLTRGQLPLIGVGGIESAADAYEKICAGATLVQLYTALAFHGPMLVSQLKSQLAELLADNGFMSIRDAVGSRNAEWADKSFPSQVARTLKDSYEKAGMISRAKRRRLSREPWPLSST
jgi:dihydroorotate dehydrogenase